MPYFFNGRLWVTPAVMSAINDSAMANQNLTVGNVLAVVGPSIGGAPKTAMRFGNPADAKALLQGGDLLTAVLKAFSPSSETGGPATIVAVRTNPATQSTLTLNNLTAQAAIILQSTDYGVWTNQIKVKVDNGSSSGRKYTVTYGTQSYIQDNVSRQAFTIQYSGAANTATITVSNTAVSLQAPIGVTVASIDLNTYATVQQLVDRINAVTGFSATVVSGSASTNALNGLDAVTNLDVKTSLTTITADLQAGVDWFNSTAEGLINATRDTNATSAPAAISYTYLIGGSDGTQTITDWQNAFDALQAEDVQWVVPTSSDPAVHAMVDAHVQFMSTVGQSERRAIVGCGTGMTDANAIAAAKALNSDRTSYTHLGYYDYDVNGKLVLLPAYQTAAAIAGAFSGVNPGTAMTNKSLALRGVERKLKSPTDTDALINGGVLAVGSYTNGFRVVKSITTWLNNRNFNRVEVSVGVATDFTVRNVRNALDSLRGAKGNQQTLTLAVQRTASALALLAQQEPQGPGVLAGDSKNPAYMNITATLSGDVLAVSFQCSPVIPVNYVPVSVWITPFTGSAKA